VIRNVIFDLDDTLFMTEEASYRVENEVAMLLGHPPMSRAVHQANWGEPIEKAIIERIPGIEVVRFLDLLPRVIQQFAEDERIDVLSQANMSALEELMHSGYNLSIVTSRTLGEAEHLLSPDHKLRPFIPPQSFFHKDNNMFVKPDPRAFDAVMGNGSRDHGLYVGDSVGDCIAAKAAGLHFVACMESGLRSPDDFNDLDSPPDGYIDTLAELPSWLESYNTRN
jgi:phosphoglycolate phosphatase